MDAQNRDAENREDPRRLEIATRYAWEWMYFHAGHRATMFRYYLVMIGIVGWGYVKFSDQQSWWLAALVAAFGVLVSVAFLVLEIRNTELVYCGRAALDELEQELGVEIRRADRARRFFPVSLDIISRPFFRLLGFLNDRALQDTRRGHLTRHEFWFRAIQYVTMFAFALLTVGAMWRSVTEATLTRRALEQRVDTESGRALLESVERLLDELVVVHSVIAETPDINVSGRVTALFAVAEVLRDRCARRGIPIDACAGFEAWHKSVVGVYKPLAKGGVSAAGALKLLPVEQSVQFRRDLTRIRSQFEESTRGVR